MHSTHQIPICKSFTNNKKKHNVTQISPHIFSVCKLLRFIYLSDLLSPLSLTQCYACAIFIALKGKGKKMFSHTILFFMIIICYIACWSGRGINNLIKNSQNYSRNLGFIVICIYEDWQMHACLCVRKSWKSTTPNLECGNISGLFEMQNVFIFYFYFEYW